MGGKRGMGWDCYDTRYEIRYYDGVWCVVYTHNELMNDAGRN